MADPADPLAPAARSTFVTVVAWLFIAFAGLATLVCLLQNIMVHAMMSDDAVQASLARARQAEDLPAFAAWLANDLRVFLGTLLLVSMTVLATAIGLVRRQRWARPAFIAIMALGIAWNAFVLAVQVVVLWPVGRLSVASEDTPPGLVLFSFVVIGIGAILAIGLSWLYAWIIRRLMAAAVVAEFRAS